MWRLIAGVLAHATVLAAAPTFNKDVLPILQKNCQSCHRPGEAGPMSLLTYERTRPWAKAIKAAVAMGKMPPWFADPKYGRFANDRRLSAADVKTLEDWVNAGAPEGEPHDKPAPVKWIEGWNIRADQIFQMPDPFTVPANGALDYVYIVIPTGFRKDTWVTAAEVRPSARSVVHHVLAVVRPPGSQLAQGTRMEVTAHWDNSAANPNNPDATKTVKYGFQSTDEMLNAAMGVIIDWP